MDKYQSNLVWIDLEMTGLNPAVDTILEIASLVTDNNLDIISYGPSLVIHHDEEALAKMNSWCVKQHAISGLTEAALSSTITLEEAERQTFEFLQNYSKPGLSPLCGNSVWQDRIFLNAYMPKIDSFLHYRIIDVSSIKEVIMRWYFKSSQKNFFKPDNHRAQEDIIQSVEELKHYRHYFFQHDNV